MATSWTAIKKVNKKNMTAREKISDCVRLVSTRLLVTRAMASINRPIMKLHGTTHDLRLPMRLKNNESTKGALF